jgi:catechol 2,3-dioxygenase-like lactoylglutathione lyase family enzyme
MTHTQPTTASDMSIASLSMINIDSANPAELARFYAAALGWEVTYSDENYGMVEGNGIRIGFGKVEEFPPFQWPDEAGTKRFHLDLHVDALDAAAERLCAIGATQPDFQPGGDRWRVLLDPDGRPFCLNPRPSSQA